MLPYSLTHLGEIPWEMGGKDISQNTQGTLSEVLSPGILG